VTEPLPFPNSHVLTVSALNRRARLLLEGRFNPVRVRGEISNYRRPRSGHWYFTLKDEDAQVRCAMFFNRNRFSRVRPMDGTEVIVRGRVSLYENRGDYQIIVEAMEPAGEGALRAAFEALKQRLAAEGLFRAEYKKELPAFPAHLAIVSSASGAAVRDVLSILRRRFPCMDVTLLPVAVQGPDAERQLLAALRKLPGVGADIVLITRGGGSLEDLFVFNSEKLARAIAACPLPTVAAIGHETDITITELVADLRGATPSAAAELLSPDGATLAQQLEAFEARLQRACTTRIELAQHRIAAVRSRLIDPRHRMRQLMQRADDIDERLRLAMAGRLEHLHRRLHTQRISLGLLRPTERIEGHKRTVQQLVATARYLIANQLRTSKEQLTALTRTLHAVSPLDALARGYAIVTTPEGKLITDGSDIEQDAQIVVNLRDAALRARVGDRQPLPERLRPFERGLTPESTD